MAQVESHKGHRILVPDGMSLDAAILALDAAKKDMLTKVGVNEMIRLFPLDGAYVLQRCIKEMFGRRSDLSRFSFFGGEKPPDSVSVEVSPGVFENVVWGDFTLPGIEGTLSCGTNLYDGMPVFMLNGSVLRRDEPKIKELMDFCRKKAFEYSIYKAKALVMEPAENREGVMSLFTNPPRFFALNGLTKADIVLPEDTWIALDAGLFTLIEKAQKCRKLGISTKRAVVLGGAPGTGKTLAGAVAASLCTMHDRTFILMQDTKFLPEALKFAATYGPTLIYGEDIERVMQERDKLANQILNAVDGVESKNLDVILVFTTNYPEKIIDTFRRGGRGDWIIQLPYPDADAAERLLKKYAPNVKMQAKEWHEVGEILAQARVIPANIREVCHRAMLVAIRNDQEEIGYPELRVAAKWVVEEKGDARPEQMPTASGLMERAASGVDELKQQVRLIGKKVSA